MAQRLDIIETERLIFRGIDESDAKLIVEWRSAPEVYKYFKSPHEITVEEHLNWYNNTYLTNDNRFDWMCIEKKSKNRIGVFGLCKEDDRVEVNYLLIPEVQHKGYATEAIRSLVNYASGNWNIRNIVAEIHEENIPSIKLIEKLGFKVVKKEEQFVTFGLEV